jgi:type I restriction enzyme M protein
MTVIRRLDAVLEPTKQAVLDMKDKLDRAGIVTNQHIALCQASHEAFYNTSKFTLRDLQARAKQQQLKADFEAYLEGFSPNVQEILSKFKLYNQIPTLVEADILGSLIEKFLDPSVNLGPKPVLDADERVRLAGLDNHAMGTIFEELIRRFNEENNEEAGEHFTPRDVVRLMAKLIFLPIAEKIESGTYLLYDGACGTGGMLTVAEETLLDLARQRGKDVSIYLFGQEVNPETYAITKADLLLKGEGGSAENMAYGSSLSADNFPSHEFDFMLSNPPYGKSWKTDLERMGGKDDIKDPRFIMEHAGDPEFNLITRSSDGQLMFLANLLSKMKHTTDLGSRIAEVHNGSSLFTGDAGQGESNIRRWIIENDWLEAIIALPLNMFYNTGIATYIWVLSNKKPVDRQGKVQLIDATEWYKPLRKNLGKKNCEFGEEDIKRICDTFLAFQETEQSKIFPNEAFGYWKITVERPLRLKVDLSDSVLARFRRTCKQAGEEGLADLIDRVAVSMGPGPHMNFNDFTATLEREAKTKDVSLPAKRLKLIQSELAARDEAAAPVIKKAHKPGKAEADPVHGRFEEKPVAPPLSAARAGLKPGATDDLKTKPCVVEYEPDSELRDTEQVPLLEAGGIEAFFRREVLPYAPDAWIDREATKIGYEVSFTRYFYKPKPLRTLEEIRADIVALEKESEGLLGQIMVETEDAQ